MVLSSYSFLFGFLPLVLLGYYLLGARGRLWASVWLLLASLASYSFWDYRFLPILLGSIAANFFAYTRIVAAAQPPKKLWLTCALAFNLLMLATFKYANFFIESINALTGIGVQPLALLLPIGISFFTFTQISLLVDAYQGKVPSLTLGTYTLFVSYFPYIVAGPVLHHRDILPQIADAAGVRPKVADFAVGLTLFTFGAAKKLLLADNLIPLVNLAFQAEHPQLAQAWLGVFAYALQLYFDFSGYSDMAIGVSRLFGIQIPFNFNSPYKAASVSEFWLRWHISLSRFLRNYLYIPLGGNRSGEFSRYRNLLLTMLLGGLWHGSNWTFVVWGGLHGLYLCVQHGWRALATSGSNGSTMQLPRWACHLLTMLAVLVAWCFFRATSVGAALDILSGMVGRHGLGAVPGLQPFTLAILALSTWIALFMPNTNEVFAWLESRFANSPEAKSLLALRWHPSWNWGLVTGVVFALCLLSMEKTQDFIYAQF